MLTVYSAHHVHHTINSTGFLVFLVPPDLEVLNNCLAMVVPLDA